VMSVEMPKGDCCRVVISEDNRVSDQKYYEIERK